MNQFDRSILMGPNYIGSSKQVNPYIRRMPQLHELKLTEMNTTRTCRVCRGRKVIINQHSNGLMDYEPCPACKMSGIMPNSEVRR